jgi:hypothetical protein
MAVKLGLRNRCERAAPLGFCAETYSITISENTCRPRSSGRVRTALWFNAVWARRPTVNSLKAGLQLEKGKPSNVVAKPL